MKKKYTLEDIRKVLKPADAWWTVLVIDPIAIRLLWIVSNFTKLTPNQITAISFIFGLLSALSFLQGTWIYLILGAFLFQICFLIDCIDGKLARLKGLKSGFGAYLDAMLDRCRVFIVVLCLVYGQYILTKDISYFLLGFGYFFANVMYVMNMEILHRTNPSTYGNSLMEKSLKLGKLEIKPHLHSKRLLTLPFSDIETDALIFFIAPLLHFVLPISIKLGLLIGSIILLITTIGIAIFSFLSVRNVKKVK